MNKNQNFEDIVKIEKKISKIICCVDNLEMFCRNKIGNKSFEHKFGEINKARQNVKIIFFLIFFYEIL